MDLKCRTEEYCCYLKFLSSKQHHSYCTCWNYLHSIPWKQTDFCQLFYIIYSSKSGFAYSKYFVYVSTLTLRINTILEVKKRFNRPATGVFEKD